MTIFGIWVEWKKRFQVSIWPYPSNQSSAHEDIWFGGCCLKNFKIAILWLAIFDIWMKWFKQFWVWFLPCLFGWCLPSRFCSRGHMVWKMLFEAVKFSAIVDIWMKYLIYSESPCCMMPPIKFLLKRICGLEEVVWKFPRRLFSAWPSCVSEWNERSIYESLFGLKHPIKFLLMRSYGLEEDVFLKNIKIAV